MEAGADGVSMGLEAAGRRIGVPGIRAVITGS